MQVFRKRLKGAVENLNLAIKRVERLKKEMQPYAPEHRQNTCGAFSHGEVYNQKDPHEGEEDVCTR